MRLGRVPSHLQLRNRRAIEERIRDRYDGEFYDGSPRGVARALYGMHGIVCASEDPRLALEAALWVFCTWICSKKEIPYQDACTNFLAQVRTTTNSEHTNAFLKGMEFIISNRQPVSDYSGLYCAEAV